MYGRLAHPRTFAAFLLVITAFASIATAGSEPPVKKSRASICHAQGTPGYEQTVHFKSFETVAACLKSGGRLPKGLTHAKAQFDPTKPAHPGDVGVLFGPLVRVIDGDTLVVRIQGAELTIRLSGIDAPEHDQPFGNEARNELAALIGEQECVLVYEEGDTYGRLVAHLWVGDSYVNAELMRRGMAWFDSESAENEYLFNFEEEARAAKLGLWALPIEMRVPPRDWRSGAR